MEEKKVAILIDGDNISPKYSEYIKQEAARSGRIKICRLYGSITSPTVKAWYKEMPKYGITPVLQINYIDNKSIADQALTIDAMDILYEEEIDVICLVSSDSDFTKLAYRIKESGKFVIGMGEQKANESIVQACDEFKMLDLIYKINIEDKNVENEISEEQLNIEEENEENGQNLIGEEVDVATYVPTEKEIVDNIKQILDDDWENLANVGMILNKQRPGFDTRIYGCRSMKQLIEKHCDVFDIKAELAKDQIHKVIYAKLKS